MQPLTRQCAILCRSINSFRTEHGLDKWPCIIAGGRWAPFDPRRLFTTMADFNFAPDDLVYSLLVGDVILPEQHQPLLSSRVVHASIDATFSGLAQESVEEETEGSFSDGFTVNARQATVQDGLFTVDEFINLFSGLTPLRSAYDEALGRLPRDQQVSTFGSRINMPPDRKGANEPEYTSYTHYWKNVLGQQYYCCGDKITQLRFL